MENDETVELSLTWSEKKVFDGKSFDDKFELDGIPLGWFYKKFFLPNVIPEYVNPTPLICMKKKITVAQNIFFSLGSRALPLLLLLKEQMKIKRANRKKTFDGKSKALFLSYSNHMLPNGKIFRIQNIVDDLEKDKQIEPLILFAEPLSSSKSFKNTMYQYCTREIIDEARNESRALYQSIKRLSRDGLSNAFVIGNTSVFKEYSAAYRMYFSRQFLFILFLMYKLCFNLLNKENVRVIVLTSPNSLAERCLIAAAHKKKIPAIVIQHGMGMGRLVDKRVPIHFAVFGDFHAQQLMKNGAVLEYVHKVGPVIFDDLIYEAKEKQKEKTVLFATAPMVDDNELSKREYFDRVELILKAISEIKNTQIVVKLHPREKYRKEYAKLISRLGLSSITLLGHNVSREEFYRQMSICSSFVHFGTTAALEAMILGKPVVTIHVRDFKVTRAMAWLKEASILVNYKEDIRSAVERSFNDEKALRLKREKYIKKFCGEVDGKSHLRVAQLVYSLINAHKGL